MSVRPNPYVGPRSFRVGEKVFGRARETAELIDLLIAERIVLMSSPSGAGKSSLINAALGPLMGEHGFVVYPTMRVGRSLPPNVAAPADANRFVVSLLQSLEETQPTERRLPLDALMRMTFEDYLAHRKRVDATSDSVLLVFDQFEEILTVDPTRRAAKQEFFDQVGRALRDRTRWALFAMREEYVAALMPYARSIPTRLATTFRLDLLGKASAMEAIAEPAREAGVAFEPAAVEQLVRFLEFVVRVQQPDGTATEEPGDYVEPVQLQVVCRRLWDTLPADATVVTAEHVRTVGQVERALADYYEDVVRTAARRPGGSERAIREWVEKALITPSGIRGEVMQTPTATSGLDNAVIAALVDGYLVREDKRRGNTWYELAHDRLIEPVRISNAAWFEQNLHPMQRQAALWERGGKPDSLLLRGQDLERAERWASDNAASLLPIETDLLTRSAKQRLEIDKEEARRRRELRQARTFAAVVGGLLLCALGAFGAALYQRNVAIEQERLETSGRLALLAINQLNHADLALLLSVQANRTASTIAARNSLATTLAHNPRLLKFLHGHRDRVRSVAFSPVDPNLLISGGDGKDIRVWNLAKPESSEAIREVEDVSELAFNPSGSLFATANDTKKIRLWDVHRRAPVGELIGHTDRAFCVVFRPPNGDLLASASEDGTVRLWDLAKGAEIGAPLVGHDGGKVQSLAISHDGKRLASGGHDETIALWDVASAKPLELLHGGADRVSDGAGSNLGFVKALAFSPTDATLLVSGGEDGGIRFWNVGGEPPTLLGAPRENAVPVMHLAFAPQGQVLASSSYDGAIRLWDVSRRRPLGEPLRGHSLPVRGVAFSPDSKLLASASDDRMVGIWNVEDPRETPSFWPSKTLRGHDGGVASVAFSPTNGSLLASGGYDETVRLWNVMTGELVGMPLVGHTDSVVAVAFSPDGKRLASGSNDKTVRIWDVATAAQIGLPLEHGEAVESVSYSADGNYLVTASRDRTVRLWDVQTGKLVAEPLTTPQGVFSAAISPDGKLIVAGLNQYGIGDFDPATKSEGIRLWDLTRRPPQALDKTFRGHRESVIGVAFSPDGKLLASASRWRTVILWNVATREPLGEPLAGHGNGGVYGIAFSPDGKRLASASHDHTVRLWDVASGQSIGPPLTGHDDLVQSVAFSRDGKLLASASFDGTIRLWDVDETSWPRRACAIANRNLRLKEWELYIGKDVPYCRTCPDLPAPEQVHKDAPACGAAP